MLPWALDIFDGIWAKKQHKICQLVIYENHGEKKKINDYPMRKKYENVTAST